ncbi:MAG: putative sugar O-methyltransferase [Acidimicrobiia bacterium]
MSGRLRHARRAAKRALLSRGLHVSRLPADERRFLTALVDDRVPLPASARELRSDAPRLAELRAAYALADPAVRVHSRWTDDVITPWLDLAYFRGDNAYVWQYREGRRVSELKYLVYLQDLLQRDRPGLLDRLGEDGAFGCWTFEFDGLPRCSRDLLDSVNELLFLDDALGVLGGSCPRVLDVGAGYGRLAHRYVAAVPDVDDYCCVDAIPESSFLCEYYLQHRQVSPPARVVPLPEVTALAPGSFDLAVNVHSWSECTLDAISWWVDQLVRLEVPQLFVVPNEAEGFLSLEVDGRRHPFLPVLEAGGYRLVRDEPAFSPAVRAALAMRDRHCLFERRT